MSSNDLRLLVRRVGGATTSTWLSPLCRFDWKQLGLFVRILTREFWVGGVFQSRNSAATRLSLMLEPNVLMASERKVSLSLLNPPVH